MSPKWTKPTSVGLLHKTITIMRETILKVVAVSYAIMTMMLVCISYVDLACIFGLVSMISALELTHIKIKKQ